MVGKDAGQTGIQLVQLPGVWSDKTNQDIKFKNKSLDSAILLPENKTIE